MIYYIWISPTFCEHYTLCMISNVNKIDIFCSENVSYQFISEPEWEWYDLLIIQRLKLFLKGFKWKFFVRINATDVLVSILSPVTSLFVMA